MPLLDISVEALDELWRCSIAQRLHENKDDLISEWAVLVEGLAKEPPSTNRVMYLMETMEFLLQQDNTEDLQALALSDYYMHLWYGETPKMSHVLVKQLIKE